MKLWARHVPKPTSTTGHTWCVPRMRVRQEPSEQSTQGDTNERQSESRHEQGHVPCARVRLSAIELASVEVDVPMYTKTDNKLDNMQQGHVTADVPDGFNEKVKDALHVFADTLQASFNEEGE